ncbi:hypothetical protein F5Y15DRAFT_426805 [Xylariaceae sp. FL0016]|nr:hypothetical protein F5Y15DRAFT_426805 [Xylariaceae sp. FL0016]
MLFKLAPKLLGALVLWCPATCLIAGNIAQYQVENIHRAVSPDTISTTAESKAALPRRDDIPPPECFDHDPPFMDEPVEGFITQFCNQPSLWNTVLTSPISIGTGHTPDNRPKELSFTANFSTQDTTAYNLWLGLLYPDDTPCSAPYAPFTSGATDADKFNHCADRLRSVLNNCQPDLNDSKRGGRLRDDCVVYAVTSRPAGVDPWAGWFDVDQLGRFECRNDGGAGVCSCWYSAYPALTDRFQSLFHDDCTQVTSDDQVELLEDYCLENSC